MRIDLTPFNRTGESSLAFSLKGDLRADDLPFTVHEPVCVQGAAAHLGEGEFQLTGTLQADLTLTCDRCLDPVNRRVCVEFDERFERGSDEQDLQRTAYSFSGDSIELNGMLREALLLHLPMRTLCQDDCRGLCPQCGCNLNNNNCACVPERSTGFDELWTHFHEEED